MKRTILRRTQITIESLEITTIRGTAATEVWDASTEADGTRLVQMIGPEHPPTRMERVKELLRRKNK